MSGLTGPAATGIGSVPFTDPQETVALVLETLPQIPYWPQMVRLGYLEEMAAQAARGLPGLKVDEANRTVAMDPDLPRDEALAQFYEVVLSGDLTPLPSRRKTPGGSLPSWPRWPPREAPARPSKASCPGR